MSEDNNQWIRDNIISVVAVSITILTILYFSVVQDNDDTNQIKMQYEMIIEMKASIRMLEDKKVDKEVFMMLQTIMAGMATDIKEIRTTQVSEKIKTQ